MAEKSKYQDIDAVDAALDKGVAASTAIGDSSSGLTKKVTDLELQVSDAVGTINIFDPNNLADGGQGEYIDNNGNISSTTYGAQTSAPMEVKGSTLFVTSDKQLKNVYNYRFLDEDGNKIAKDIGGWGKFNGLNQMSISIPSGAKYFQISNENISFAKVFANSTSITSIADLYNTIKTGSGVNTSSIVNASKTIEPSSTEILSNDGLSCYDWDVVMTIEFTSLTSIKVTKGLLYYGISNIEITPTSLIETYAPSTSYTKTKTWNHGLSLDKSFTILISSKNGVVSAVLMSESGVYSTTLSYFDGTDGLSVTNGCLSNILVKNYSCDYTRLINNKILIIGDSYEHERWGDVHGMNFNYSWTANAKKNGASFSNVGFPGANKNQLLTQLKKATIEIKCTPKYIIWADGMNDSADANSTTPNSDWLSCLNDAKAEAERIGAMFIPCTIPSVPNKNHGGKSYYIRENYSRYIDFDMALTNGREWASDGSNWNDGYLNADKVHPNPRGFEALLSRVIMDIPEIIR